MKTLKRVLAVLLAVSMLLALAACAKTPETPSGSGNETTAPSQSTNQTTPGQTEPEKEQPKYGGHLNVRIVYNPKYPDPTTSLSTWTYMYLPLIFQNPLVLDAEGNVQPNVCDYELSEDGLTIKLWVREGKKFSNGDPVDIYDVEASATRPVPSRRTMWNPKSWMRPTRPLRSSTRRIRKTSCTISRPTSPGCPSCPRSSAKNSL